MLAKRSASSTVGAGPRVASLARESQTTVNCRLRHERSGESGDFSHRAFPNRRRQE